MARKAKAADFIKEVEKQVANHSIYVWSAAGQLCSSVNEKWIRDREAKNQNGKYADEAVAAWKEVMASPYKDVARCFDCSGLVSYCLMQLGALDKRTDCDGLYSKCGKTTDLENGTLLFRVSTSDPNDETHVGVYSDGYQLHAKGRKEKVIKEKFNKSWWAKYGWFVNLTHEEPEPTPVPPEPSHYVFTRILKYGCKGDDVVELKKLLIGHGFSKGISVDKPTSVNFGSATRRCVKEYQISANLKVDGIAGRDTITSLGGIFMPS